MNTLQKTMVWAATLVGVWLLSPSEPQEPIKWVSESSIIEKSVPIKQLEVIEPEIEKSVPVKEQSYIEVEEEIIIPKKVIPIVPIRSNENQCHPSYGGCLKKNAWDYDCAWWSGNWPNYTGRIRVVGYDEFDLDRDNDWWGCE
jgi:hypothetical protein